MEADRGSKRRDQALEEERHAYGVLFAGGFLSSETGRADARFLVVVPEARRQDRPAERIAEADKGLASRFWVAEKAVLEEASLNHSCWRIQGGSDVRSLISPSWGITKACLVSPADKQPALL